METLEFLAKGDEGVRSAGFSEYFNSFYDLIDHRSDALRRPANSAFSDLELMHLREVSQLMDDASDATPKNMSVDEFIATGWPSRIQPHAEAAIAVMRQRGTFSEDEENWTL